MISWLAPIPGRDLDYTTTEAVPDGAEVLRIMVEAMGGWVCEQHPDKPWPHDDCDGPGRLREDGDGDLP